MKKIIFTLILIIIPFTIYALDYPELDSKIVEVYDLTDDKVLYEIDSNKQSSIASLTKIVTTITAIENIDNLDEKVTITSSILNTVRWDASIAGLKSGDILTYKDLLYASMLPSGADATNSLAILSSGSIDNFVSKMNDLVVNKIGVNNTHFVNVTGLDADGHYSTADDIRKILSYALKNDIFKQIYTTRKYTLSNGLTVNSTINTYNANSNLNTNNIIGSKTGFTLDAGYCLSSLSKAYDHEIIIIVLNATHRNNTYYNISDTIELINFVKENYKYIKLVEENKLIKTIQVKDSKIDEYEIKSQNNIIKYLPIDYDENKIKIEYDGLEELSYKNKNGDKIGEVKYYYDNELLLTDEILLNEEIKIDYLKIIKREKHIVIIGTIIVLLVIIFIALIKNKRKNISEN